MTRRTIRCVLVGDEPLMAQCAEIVRAHDGLEVVLLASTNDLVREYAAEQSIPAVGQGAELVGGLIDHPADVLFSIANMHDIPDEALARVGTAIHYHDGPLPGYAGLNVTSWAILAG
jgi:hypothetical protein